MLPFKLKMSNNDEFTLQDFDKKLINNREMQKRTNDG